jgi:hypothetical protein
VTQTHWIVPFQLAARGYFDLPNFINSPVESVSSKASERVNDNRKPAVGGGTTNADFSTDDEEKVNYGSLQKHTRCGR